ncbi:hypothetical protein LIA77_01905 [Sarocladium implicatum]|nr:hypothetical protein LIA77_01905 [Sarocladium implicatum]
MPTAPHRSRCDAADAPVAAQCIRPWLDRRSVSMPFACLIRWTASTRPSPFTSPPKAYHLPEHKSASSPICLFQSSRLVSFFFSISSVKTLATVASTALPLQWTTLPH